MIKPILYGENETAKAETKATFAWVLDRILVVLHPFMPYITTQLWDNLADRDVKLLHHKWPLNETIDNQAKEAIDWAIDVISAIRSLRAEMNLPAGAKLKACIKDDNDKIATYIKDFANIICSLARLESIEILQSEVTPDMVQTVCQTSTILLPLKGVVDFSAERERLQKELASLEKNLAGYAAKLSNPNFVERAPAKVVEEEKKRQAEALENKAKVEEALERIANL